MLGENKCIVKKMCSRWDVTNKWREYRVGSFRSSFNKCKGIDVYIVKTKEIGNNIMR